MTAQITPTTFTIFDRKDRRWWVLTGPSAVVVLTGIPLPGRCIDLSGEILDEKGERLLPEMISIHRPGSEPCPALPDGCDGAGDARSGHRELFRAWVESGYDDSVIELGLAQVHDESRADVEPPVGRQCRNCGAITGLRRLMQSPLSLDGPVWECVDGCPAESNEVAR